MKKNVFVLMLFFASLCVLAQGNLSDKGKEKASQVAKAEATMFTKKGMSNVVSSESVEEVLRHYYELAYTEDSPNNPHYVRGTGNKKSNSSSEAYGQAFLSAKEHIPGLLASYFAMWTMAADNLSEADKSTIQNAISKATPSFTTTLVNKEPIFIVHLQGENKGKFRSQVRVMYEQEEVREIVRNEIKLILKEDTDWTEEKMTRALTFDH